MEKMEKEHKKKCRQENENKMDSHGQARGTHPLSPSAKNIEDSSTAKAAVFSNLGIKNLEKEVAELQNRVSDTENKWKRALADYQNLEKRTQEQKVEFIEFANYNIILELLDVIDCLESTTDHIKDDGLNLSVKKFKDVLSNNGVTEIKAENEDFNASLMEAIDTQKGTENKVLKVNKKGYILNNKVLRPAQVVVGRKE